MSVDQLEAVRENEEKIAETNEYHTMKECAKQTGLKNRQIEYLCKSGRVSSYKAKNNRLMVSLKSLESYIHRNKHLGRGPNFIGNPKLAFGDVALDADEVMKPVSSYNIDIFDSYRHEYDVQYLITNKGKVFCAATGIFLNPDIKNTYYYVNLPKYEKPEHVYIHRLVAYFFCDNRHFKQYVHHIDGNPLNNNAKNLLWVTSEEHGALHKLLKQETKREYRKMVSKIRKENKW